MNMIPITLWIFAVSSVIQLIFVSTNKKRSAEDRVTIGIFFSISLCITIVSLFQYYGSKP